MAFASPEILKNIVPRSYHGKNLHLGLAIAQKQIKNTLFAINGIPSYGPLTLYRRSGKVHATGPCLRPECKNSGGSGTVDSQLGSLSSLRTVSCGCERKRGVRARFHYGLSEYFPARIIKRWRDRALDTMKEFDDSMIGDKYFDQLMKLQNEACALCGLKLAYAARELTWRKLPSAEKASADRINSQLGYIRGNIQMTHWKCNSIKNIFTETELLEVCLAITNHLQKKISL